ncbi:L-2-hydroxyglutarate oxidase [Flavobacteriaceae bacterium]|nr:L-2-hydroxyglutarate oxidase [Flavobacteriaceae bacterium]
MKEKAHLAIIGAGIVGLAIAYKLSLQNKKVTVFEKESQEGLHQSGRNSGVLHCGLYYQPGSLKAQLSVQGIREMISFCKQHHIPHDICGKVVVASNTKEEMALDKLAARGKENGLSGLTYLTPNQLKKREPFVSAYKTLLVPEEGIVDYKAVMKKMVQLICEMGGEVHYESPITKIENKEEGRVNILTNQSSNHYDYLISCTGLWSDKTFTNLTYKKAPLKIIPFRGEYLKFKSGFEDRVNHLVYPVPDAQFPFLGVHFTRMIDDSREVGPNAVLALKREGYKRNSFVLKEAHESLSYPGLLRFVAKNFQFSINEFKSSLFMKDFIAKAQKMIPDVDATMLERGPAGVRAQAISPKGELQMDFNIIQEGRQIHVLNAPSPGATASLAIASHIIENYLPN